MNLRKNCIYITDRNSLSKQICKQKDNCRIFYDFETVETVFHRKAKFAERYNQLS